jgi:hypothetical protein
VCRAANFDVLVRNVYKVLLTRGLVGCVIYSTDPETRALLTKLGIPRSENVKRSTPIPGVREVGQGCHQGLGVLAICPIVR